MVMVCAMEDGDGDGVCVQWRMVMGCVCNGGW